MPTVDTTVNLGHIIVLVGMLGSAAALYATIKSSDAVQSNKIAAIERSLDRQETRSEEMASAITRLTSDVAIIHYRLGNTKGSP